jgi:hypothetical protein
VCSLQNRRRIGPTFRALLLPAGERPALEQTAVTNWVRRPRPDDGAGRWRSGRAVRRASRSNGRSHHAEAGGWFEVDSRGHRLQFGIVDRHPLHGGIEVPVGRVLGWWSASPSTRFITQVAPNLKGTTATWATLSRRSQARVSDRATAGAWRAHVWNCSHTSKRAAPAQRARPPRQGRRNVGGWVGSSYPAFVALTKANTRRPGRGAGGPLSQIDGGKGCYVIDRNPACADKLHFYDKPLRPRGL